MVRPYRKYRCLVEWKNAGDITNTIHSSQRIINLADVIDYEEFNEFGDNIKRTMIHIGINKPSIVIRVPMKEFEELHDKFLVEYGILDDRSLKKNTNYNGPVKWLFAQDTLNMAGFMFPKDHDFDKMSSQRNMDFVISKYSTTFN